MLQKVSLAGAMIFGLAAGLTMVDPAQGRGKNAKAPQFSPTRSIVYKTTKDAKGNKVELKLYIFEPAGHKRTDKRPGAVFFFGGGWVGGSPKQFYAQCAYLASRGIWACAADYRVASRHKTTPFACVADGKSAVRYLRSHAKQLGLDPDKIIAGGGSAGGHVAACTGTIQKFDEPTEDASVSSIPNAMVLFNPVADTSKLGYGYDKVKERWKEISPAHNIHKATPPTIILHGKADTTVPYKNVELFAANMKAQNRPCTLVGFPNQKHGFFNHSSFRKTSKNDINFLKTMQAVDAFLVKHNFLTGKNTVKKFLAKKH